MKVHLIKEQTIKDYYAANPGSKAPFEEWMAKLKRADWISPEEIKATFGTADLLGKSSRRVVFDIGGNGYRMICKYKFTKTQVHLSIKWIGAHSEYDKLCGYGKNKKKRSQDVDQYTINH
ncbi:MAG: type II toxin-antitoxin system HigB family toxin [Flavisolibacter sp.]